MVQVPFDTAGMRHRSRDVPATLEAPVYNTYITQNGVTSHSISGSAPMVTSITRESIYDVVIKDFHRRQAAGEIFNNRMVKTHSVSRTPLTPYSVLATFSNGSQEWSGTTPYQQPAFKLQPKIEPLVNQALTAAYAGVSANQQNALLWFGELRESISMFKDIGMSLAALVKKTEKQRLKWLKGKLTVKEQQSLTLGLLYGILPLEEQIASFLDGLFNLKTGETRETSRGFAVRTDTATHDYIHDQQSLNYARARATETIEVKVRAGVLYDVDTSEIPYLAVMADPKQVISTAYALARLSFVIDWFINVGNTMKAWAPSAGTKELASWYTVEVTQEIVGTHTIMAVDTATPQYSSVSASGSSSFGRTEYTKYRVPAGRSDLAIFPRISLNLDLDKIFALILLFAKVKR